MKKAVVPCLPFLLAACGGGGDEAAPDPLAAAAPALSAQAAATPVVTTREGAERAYHCRGLISAAAAARMALPSDQVPQGLATLSIGDASYWNNQIAGIAPGVLSPEDEARLTTSSTRVLATRQALEEQKSAILECLAAIPKI